MAVAGLILVIALRVLRILPSRLGTGEADGVETEPMTREEAS